MYYSLTFTDIDNSDWRSVSKVINTWDTWKLIPIEKPIIALPAVKTNFAEVKGVSGSVDYSESLSGVPTYGDRTGSISFHVMEPVNWPELYGDISSFFHNKRLKMFLEEEPEYYYIGRFAVNDITQEDDYPQLSLNYTLYPYKISMFSTIGIANNDGEDWLWDSLNFTDGVVSASDYTFTFNKNSDASFNGTTISSPSSALAKIWFGEYQAITGANNNLPYYRNHKYRQNQNLSEGIVCPIINLNLKTQGISSTAFKFVNRELGISSTGTLNNGTSMNTLIQFSNLTRRNRIEFYIRNAGTISFDMRRLML